MSLLGFQRALADLVASPALCRAAGDDPGAALAGYDLTARERRRVADMARQPGMAVNRALYRANRAVPALTFLPLTCFLLGDRLRGELDRFWAEAEAEQQLGRELLRFGNFLRERLALGEIAVAALDEVLAFELARLELQLSPAGEHREQVNAQLRPHPRVRAVRFGRNPAVLLRRLAERAPPPYDAAEGEFWIVVDAREESLRVYGVHPVVGHILAALHDGGPVSLTPEDARALVEAGLALPAGQAAAAV